MGRASEGNLVATTFKVCRSLADDAQRLNEQVWEMCCTSHVVGLQNLSAERATSLGMPRGWRMVGEKTAGLHLLYDEREVKIIDQYLKPVFPSREGKHRRHCFQASTIIDRQVRRRAARQVQVLALRVLRTCRAARESCAICVSERYDKCEAFVAKLWCHRRWRKLSFFPSPGWRQVAL